MINQLEIHCSLTIDSAIEYAARILAVMEGQGLVSDGLGGDWLL
jgi:hypothetical protein